MHTREHHPVQPKSSEALPEKAVAPVAEPTRLPTWSQLLDDELVGPSLQPKLVLSQPGDEYEQEADDVAKQVVQRQSPVTVSQRVEPADIQRFAESGSEAGPDQSLDVPSSVYETLESPGEPLPDETRSMMESHFGVDFGDVRVHHDAQAAQSSRSVEAAAYTVGHDVVFDEGEYAPGTETGDELIAHELTHVVQQTGSAAEAPEGADETEPAATLDGFVALRITGAGVLQRQRGRSVANPFERLLATFDRNLNMLSSFVAELDALTDANYLLQREIDNIHLALTDIQNEREATRLVADDVVHRRPLGTSDPGGNSLYQVVRSLYQRRGESFPSRRNLGIRQGQLERGMVLMSTVRVRVLNLMRSISGAPAGAAGGPPDALRSVTMDVASYYLQLLTTLEPEALQRLAFLESFYQDPEILQLYAVIRYAQTTFPDLYRSLYSVSRTPGMSTVLLGETFEPSEHRYSERDFWQEIPGYSRQRIAGHLEMLLLALNRLRDIHGWMTSVGDPPRLQQAVHQVPTPELAANISANIIQAQVEIAVAALWLPFESLGELLRTHPNIGLPLNPFAAPDRDRWLGEMQSLAREFRREVSQYPHDDIESRVQDWERRVQRLIDEIVPAAHRADIVAGIVEQIPFLFVGGGVAGGVGRWVGTLTRGSRWLMALAEGATLTVLGAVALPVRSRPTTALGWVGHFAMNVFWARMGRALFEIGGDVARGMANSRSALTRVGVELVVPGVALTTMQTAAQAIEAQVRGHGGETNLTELFTVNLIMNSLGIMLGASMQQALPSAGGARPSPADLARRTGVSEEAARQWVALADRAAEFQAQLATLEQQARRGTLTSEDFEAWRRQGLSLADDLERTMPALAEALGTGQSGDQIRAGVAALRARLNSLTYTPRPTVTALLPEFVSGLTRAGEGITYTYNPARPPRELVNLRQDYVRRGYTVRELPGGGWEAVNAQGQIVLQVLPMSRAAALALPRSLAEVAAGPQAQAGLARVRTQTAVPDLEAQLAQTAAGQPEAVTRILRLVGRFIDPTNDAAWRGLSNFLRQGGDVRALARALTFGRATREFAAENALLANRVLTQLATWDASAVRGLGLLYEVRPRMTAEGLSNLFSDFEPIQVRGIFQSIDRLAPISRGLSRVIGPLASGNEAQQRGAMGALSSANQLADQFPGRIISFEMPVIGPEGNVIRVQDIVVIEQQTTRVAGETITQEVTLAAFEIKEVSTRNLGRRGPHQLAIDILLDSHARAQRATPPGTSRPFFETFRWRIRRAELQRDAMRRLGITVPGDSRIEAEMRRMVEEQLQRAFDDPVLRTMNPTELQGYRNAFRNVPFVEFF